VKKRVEDYKLSEYWICIDSEEYNINFGDKIIDRKIHKLNKRLRALEKDSEDYWLQNLLNEDN
jgi:hypothetical protein